MFDFPDPKTKDPKKRRVQRFLEVIPGTLTWLTLIGMFALSFLVPIWVAVFVIAFDIYWILRTIYIAYYSVEGYRKLREGQKIDWWERCQYIKEPAKYAGSLQEKVRQMRGSLQEKTGLKRKERKILREEIDRQRTYIKEISKLDGIKEQILDWREIVHVVMLPTANEPAEVIEPAIQAIADCNFPNNQFIILLATEGREPEKQRQDKADYLKKKFDGVFRDFIVTTHIVKDNEMKAKGSNATFAAKHLTGYLEEKKVDFKRVIFSNFDCDSVAHPSQYLAFLHIIAFVNE